MNEFLTEEKLGKLLNIIYSDFEIIHNKKIPNHIKASRPDYRIDELKLIFEFDGWTHFCNPNRIIKDEENDLFYNSLGYKVIRIPYFIQMDKAFYKNVLNMDRENDYFYPNGFIDDSAKLPAEFCYLGLLKFSKLLNNEYNYCREEIEISLKNKIEQLGDKRLVIV